MSIESCRKIAKLLWVVMAMSFLWPSALLANTLSLNLNSQSPGNTVPRNTAVSYSLTGSNIDNGVDPVSSIGWSVRMRVNGSVVRADSAEVSATGCRVDTAFPDYFACNNLAEGGSQTFTIIWNTPRSGPSTVLFETICQILPAQTPTKFCSGSASQTTTTIVEASTIRFDANNILSRMEYEAAFVINLQRDSTDSVSSVHLATVAGTATAGSDYTAVNQTVTFQLGESVKTVNIPILDDTLVEGEETFTIELSNPSPGSVIGGVPGVIAHIQDYEAGVLALSAANYNVAENQGSVTVSVTRASGGTGQVSVQYATSNGSATAGADYTARSGTLTWADGVTGSQSFTIPILDDAVVEGNETLNVSLSAPTNQATLGRATATVTITDVEPGILGLSAASYTVNENQPSATITVARTQGTTGAASVQYATSNGSATAGADFTNSSGSLQWAAGEGGTKSFTIPILDDNIQEGNETVNITLSNVIGAGLGRGTASLTIIDVENGVLQFDPTAYSVAEDGGSVTVTVVRAAGSDGAATLDYATTDVSASAGSDYSAVSGTLSWNPGDISSRSITVPILDDTAMEGDETFQVSLTSSNVPLGTATATVTILDVEPGVLQFQTSSYEVTEAAAIATITVNRVNGAMGAVSVHYSSADGSAEAGRDYSPVSGTLSWGDGDAAGKTFTVTIATDLLTEADETVQLTLSNAAGGAVLGSPMTAVLVIKNSVVDTRTYGDAGTLVFTLDTVTAEENAGHATLVVQRLGGSDGEVTVNYASADGSAVAGQDYAAVQGSLVWHDGESATKEITLPLLDDAELEGDQNLSVALSNVGGGALLGSPAVAQLTIVDDEVTAGPVSAISALQGTTVQRRITVSSDTPGIQVSAEVGHVEPEFVEGTRGIVTYSFTVPADSEPGARISDTLMLTQTGKAGISVPVAITVRKKLVATENLSSNEVSVATVLDDLCADTASQALAHHCDAIMSLDEPARRQALQEVAPEEVAAQGNNAVETTGTQFTNIKSRLLALRAGSGGLAFSGLTVAYRGDSFPLGMLWQDIYADVAASNRAGNLNAIGSDAIDNSAAFGNPWGFFVNGKINLGKRDSSGYETGYEFTTEGITVGMDYRYNDSTFFGTALGYGLTNTDFAASGGDMSSNALNASVFGSMFSPGNLYLDGIFSLGSNRFDMKRHIVYGDTNTSADSSTGGLQYGAGLNGGYEFLFGKTTLDVNGRLDYIHVRIDGYQERGGQGLALRIGSQNADSLTTRLGARLTAPFNRSFGVLTPTLDFNWEHEYKDDGREIKATFVEDSRGSFSVRTSDPDRDYFTYNLGIALTLPQGYSAFVNYGSVLGQDKVTSHSIDFGFRMEF